jgi:hypothetical protein
LYTWRSDTTVVVKLATRTWGGGAFFWTEGLAQPHTHSLCFYFSRISNSNLSVLSFPLIIESFFYIIFCSCFFILFLFFEVLSVNFIVECLCVIFLDGILNSFWRVRFVLGMLLHWHGPITRGSDQAV